MGKKTFGLILAGFAAGAINGLFGGGGGIILIPLLSLLANIEDTDIFQSSVAIILPICLVSLVSGAFTSDIPWRNAMPWLISGTVGGYAAVRWGKKIPVLWLHTGLGIMIIYGGIRYLC